MSAIAMAVPAVNYDNETGSGGRPPKFLPGSDLMMWKLRFKDFVYYNDRHIWSSIVNGPHRPMIQETNGAGMTDVDPERYTEADNKLIDRDFKALGVVILALPTEIYNNFKDCVSAKELMDAMELRYEGSLELKESKRDMLSKLVDIHCFVSDLKSSG